MTDFETDLTERFERAAARIAVQEQASTGVRRRLRSQNRRRSATRLIGGVAAGAFVVAGLAVLSGRDQSDQPPSAAPAQLTVTYEKIAFHQEATLTCPGAEFDNSDKFTDYTIETWSDPVGKQWRTTVTYPDGTTRTVLAFGSFFFDQTGLYVGGAEKDAQLGCVNTIKPDDEFAFSLTWSSPGLDGDRVFSMNPPHENTATPQPDSTDPDSVYPPLAISSTGASAIDFRTMAVQQPGSHEDSQGRPAILWQNNSCCSQLSAEYGNETSDQTASYYVSPTTGQLLEIVTESSITNIGTSVARTTLLSSSSMTVDVGVFSTVGLGERSSDSAPESTADTSADPPPASD